MASHDMTTDINCNLLSPYEQGVSKMKDYEGERGEGQCYLFYFILRVC